jgi:hypothetical protein
MSDMVAFPGVRGSGSWSTDERPKSYREMILYLYPNGDMPLTALMSMLASESVDDPEYHWWTKTIPSQRTAITEGAVYTDTGLSAAAQWDYDTAGNNDFGAGETVYVALGTLVEAKKYRAGHIVLLRDASDPSRDTRCRVTAVDTSTFYLTCYVLKEYKGKSTETVALNNTYDTVLIIGNSNAENAVRPASISYDPVKYYNFTQIFRTPLEISRTAKKTRLRTGDAYKRLKREALEIHGMEREKAYFWGVPTEITDATTGLPHRTTDGLINFITTNAPGNVLDFTTDHSGETWIGAGEKWLDTSLEVIFRYGSRDKLAMVGSGALLGINELAKASGWQSLTPNTAQYGLKVVSWVTPFGVLHLKTAPLFSFEVTDRHRMVILDTKNLRSRYVDQTMFKGDSSITESIGTGRDGQAEEFLTEDGLEIHHPETFGIFNNVGVDAT